MWADTLEAAERAHLLRLFVWSATSIVAGTGLLAWLIRGNRRSELLQQFAVQSVAWGLIEAGIAAWSWLSVVPRDVASATRLDRFLWLNIGLDAGYMLVGTTLVILGFRLGRRLGLVGAGIAVVLQGCALGLLDLILAAQISR